MCSTFFVRDPPPLTAMTQGQGTQWWLTLEAFANLTLLVAGTISTYVDSHSLLSY